MVLVFRISVSREVGSGHFMRCTALAETAREQGHSVYFLCSSRHPALEARVWSSGIACMAVPSYDDLHHEAEWVQQFCRTRRADWLVVDGYEFDAAYCGSAGRDRKLCIIDDNGEHADCSADLILNGNVYGSIITYPNARRALCGPGYVLLRKEFRGGRSRRITLPARLLVTLGGSDPAGWTPIAMDAIQDLNGLVAHTTLIVGPLNPRAQEWKAFAGPATTVIVGAENMAELMREADFAVTASGSTVYELCSTGVPFLLCTTAQNQQRIASWFRDHDLAHVCSTPDAASLAAALRSSLADPERFLRRSEELQSLVDGEGCLRVLAEMEDERFRLRPVTAQDSGEVFRLSNDPEVRRNSTNQAEIQLESHREWFAKRLEDPDTLFYIITDPGGRFAGQVRFQKSNQVLIASLSLTKMARGRGLSAGILRQGSELASSRGLPIEAWIRATNAPSASAFKAAGYFLHRREEKGGALYEIYRYGSDKDAIQD